MNHNGPRQVGRVFYTHAVQIEFKLHVVLGRVEAVEELRPVVELNGQTRAMLGVQVDPRGVQLELMVGVSRVVNWRHNIDEIPQCRSESNQSSRVQETLAVLFGII